MNYGALTIDTSIFHRYGLSLDTEPLKSLEQFEGKPVGLVLVDVIVRELHSHMEKKIGDQVKHVNKAVRIASSLDIDASLIQAIELKTGHLDAKALAALRIEAFLEATGAEVIRSGEHVSVSKLLERYFDAKPPFATAGQKKHEFPDAICLLALESHAMKNNFKIVAVSDDGDWKAFAETSEHIDVESDLSAAIAYFHSHTLAFDFCRNLISDWEKDEFKSLVAEIESQVGNELQNIVFDVTAQSSLEWDLDDLDVRLDSMELIDSGDHESDIKVINLHDDTVTFKVKARIYCIADAQFGFSVYDSVDKDYTRLGSCSATAQPEFEVEIFVRVLGNLSGRVGELEVDTVDVSATSRLVVDFDYIEPDWHEEDFG